MTYEYGARPVLLVKCRLERQQAEDTVSRPPDLTQTPGAPCPDRRTDIVHGANSRALEGCLEAQIEIGRIDADEYIRWCCAPASNERTAQTQQFGQMLEWLDESHHRQHFRICPLFAPCRYHFRPGNAFEHRIRAPLAQRFDHAGTEQVARGLASDQSDAQRHGISE